MADRIAATFLSAPEFQRTLARSAATQTATLWTPGIFCAASVTLRAQLLHVMPPTRNSVTAEFWAAAAAFVGGAFISTVLSKVIRPGDFVELRLGILVESSG